MPDKYDQTHEPTVRCNNCLWHGQEKDLVPFDDGNSAGMGCPTCQTDAYLMDLADAVFDIRYSSDDPRFYRVITLDKEELPPP